MAEISAGILLFRRKPNFQVLLGHPGGPYWEDKDEGAWSLPIGVIEENKPSLEAAKRAFTKVMGFIPEGDYMKIGSVQQKDGKTVHAWAVEYQIPDDFEFTPDYLEMEWPPDSGKTQSFPEIDQIEYFPPFEANQKIKTGQRPFISRLLQKCSG